MKAVERKPVFDGFMLHARDFIIASQVHGWSATDIGLLIRRLQKATYDGDVATLREYHFIGRLLRKPKPRSRISKLVRARVFERDGYRCVECGTNWFLEVDHVTPVVFGGTDDYENLQTLCRGCNKAKGPAAYALRRLEANA